MPGAFRIHYEVRLLPLLRCAPAVAGQAIIPDVAVGRLANWQGPSRSYSIHAVRVADATLQVFL